MTTDEPPVTPPRPALTLLGAGGAGMCEGDVCEIPVPGEDPARGDGVVADQLQVDVPVAHGDARWAPASATAARKGGPAPKSPTR
jgi:hypothetical protein